MSAMVSRRTAVFGGVGGLVAAAAGLQVVGASGASAAASYRPLQLGSTGAAVRDVQTALSASSFWCGSVDGSYGLLTQQAVMALQKAYGKARTGKVDQATWNRIMSRQRTLCRYGGDSIEIDKTRQLLLVVRGGKVHTTLNTSTGSGELFQYNGRWIRATTPSGTYSIFRRGSNGWDYGPLGGLYRPYYFTSSGIAIHGSPSIPAYPASHGCCRVSTGAQDRLISSGLLRMGLRVRVY